MLAPLRRPPLARGFIHAHVMVRAQPGGINADLVAKMLASRAVDMGVLPPDLGLGRAGFAALLETCFPGLAWEGGDEGRDALRLPERQDLVALMLRHVGGAGEGEWQARQMAEIVAAGCMGGDHLWEDLGLWSRADLSLLVRHNFPALAAKNDRDMKWKKFLYRRLCAEDGIHVCRAPSCELCRDYDLCFGPEE